ncbi:hypothetical protein [Bradyrhizobium sp. NAS96.2]|uniref:hypothetical protein n=1 Tax=Bradyrhizobium sp. NAS96.2 TaxID=1680160 RepID=UPI001FD8C0C6|nr:hypothetical protein [Bradyrhizobium sp. NAS96.2]
MTEQVKELESRAVGVLGKIIGEVPAIQVEAIDVEPPSSRDRGADIVAHIQIGNEPRLLLCEVKSSGQPRHVRSGLLDLRNLAARLGRKAVPIFIAPYLSPEAQAVCRENNVGFVDLAGNARLVFDSVFIEKLVAYAPPAERRELKSLFKPKSAQILRLMLREPKQAWRVADLARDADVSLGHVSNVRAGLLDREWARLSEDGLLLSEPGVLLDAWRAAHEPLEAKRVGFYTVLHGKALEEAARHVLDPHSRAGRAVFASFSAAHWLAPYGRTATQYFYADSAGVELLKQQLKLAPSSKGENVVVMVPKDDGVFRDAIEPAPGVFCTSDVQTYLDLCTAGERGGEAAEHLRRTRLNWPA